MKGLIAALLFALLAQPALAGQDEFLKNAKAAGAGAPLAIGFNQQQMIVCRVTGDGEVSADVVVERGVPGSWSATREDIDLYRTWNMGNKDNPSGSFVKTDEKTNAIRVVVTALAGTNATVNCGKN